MSRQDLSDFEIGYEYVRKRYSFMAKYSSYDLWKLGTAYLQTRGANAELSRGMGFYFLELGIKIRLTEIIPDKPPQSPFKPLNAHFTAQP